ncbi:coiled-coil domain-containing protein [Micromonospora sp. NPDC003197]
MSVPGRPRSPLARALLCVTSVLAGAVVAAVPATATPVPGDEGGPPMLREVLEAAGRSYLEARTAAANSSRRHERLTTELREIERRIAELTPEVGRIAANAYRAGRLRPVMVLVDSGSPDKYLRRAEALDQLALRDNTRLHELHQARKRATRAKIVIDAELAEKQKQLAIMTVRKREAERALALVGGESTGGWVNAKSPVARPAPRDRNGSWPRESCDRNDPTTSGCITPRLLHALTETQRVGFTRYVSCYRPGGPYEHPKGRACDFSSQWKGFGGDAQGNDRIYGNNLAAFLVRNADRLGILYVIWYRQIWFPATGWRKYSAAHGDPSSDHTNHVHLSML